MNSISSYLYTSANTWTAVADAIGLISRLLFNRLPMCLFS